MYIVGLLHMPPCVCAGPVRSSEHRHSARDGGMQARATADAQESREARSGMEICTYTDVGCWRICAGAYSRSHATCMSYTSYM